MIKCMNCGKTYNSISELEDMQDDYIINENNEKEYFKCCPHCKCGDELEDLPAEIWIGGKLLCEIPNSNESHDVIKKFENIVNKAGYLIANRVNENDIVVYMV